jgi:A/G-specific adenine glycosylase
MSRLQRYQYELLASEGQAGILVFPTHRIDIDAFHALLLHWGAQAFRPFPWRLTDDPYQILMAELMLHRTQVSQVVPLYVRFMEQYPDLSILSRASQEDIGRALFSLGLHWRVGLVYNMVEHINRCFDGQIPVERDDLLSLPGVNQYIAAAVRCFGYGIAEPLIDTNTVRVTGRLTGFETKDSSRRNPVFRKLIGDMVDQQHPQAYNYALLDLAAKVCLSRRPPLCGDCVVNRFCFFAMSSLSECSIGTELNDHV